MKMNIKIEIHVPAEKWYLSIETNTNTKTTTGLSSNFVFDL